jgi:hypothetical protein
VLATDTSTGERVGGSKRVSDDDELAASYLSTIGKIQTLFGTRKVFVSLASERFSYLLDPKDSPAKSLTHTYEGRPAESPLSPLTVSILHPSRR